MSITGNVIGMYVPTDSALTQQGKPADAKAVGDALASKQAVGDYALKNEIPVVPENVSEFTNDAGYLTEHQSLDGLATEEYVDEAIQSYTETDPTVPAWAKATTKPTYTASEVGAMPANTYIPSIDGLASETYVNTAISAHNTATGSHNDIRLLINGLTTRLNALADSDDTTLDQMSEVVAYIKANKNLIDSITTDKVNVTDIVNNLTTNVTNKPLSAAQGVAIKALIDALDSSKLDTSALSDAVEDALSQAKASGEFDGVNGTSVTVSNVSSSSADGGNNVVTFSDGKTLTVKNGTKGSTGVGIQSVTQTTTSTADDGNNVITVTLSNGTTSTFKVQNGSKGSAGKTPVRGTDYWTDADKAEIKSYVEDAILGGAW